MWQTHNTQLANFDVPSLRVIWSRWARFWVAGIQKTMVLSVARFLFLATRYARIRTTADYKVLQGSILDAWKSSSKQIIDFYRSAFPNTTVMGYPAWCIFPSGFLSATNQAAGGATGFAAAGTGGINDTVNMPTTSKVIYKATGTISASATGSISDTATVTSDVSDPNTANNLATDSDTL